MTTMQPSELTLAQPVRPNLDLPSISEMKINEKDRMVQIFQNHILIELPVEKVKYYDNDYEQYLADIRYMTSLLTKFEIALVRLNKFDLNDIIELQNLHNDFISSLSDSAEDMRPKPLDENEKWVERQLARARDNGFVDD